MEEIPFTKTHDVEAAVHTIVDMREAPEAFVSLFAALEAVGLLPIESEET
jgi:hypothetical protein